MKRKILVIFLSLVAFQDFNLLVTEQEGSESGRTRLSDGGYPIRVAVKAESSRFETLFLDTLNGQ